MSSNLKFAVELLTFPLKFNFLVKIFETNQLVV